MLRKIFFPKKVTFSNNLFNKNISLLDCFPEPTLMVDGLIESGSLLTKIWQKALDTYLSRSKHPKTILILGLGGGSNVKLVSRYFPKAKITAVEIDPQIINIAKKYYHISNIKNLKIINQDAIRYVNNLRSKVYDLVLVDCFVGKNIPLPVQSLDFLKKLSMYTDNLLVNRIWYNEHHQETVFFLRKMSEYFTVIKVHTKTNILVKLI